MKENSMRQATFSTPVSLLVTWLAAVSGHTLTLYGVGLAHFVLPYTYAGSEDLDTRGPFSAIALVPLVVLSAAGMLLLPLKGTSWE